MNDMKSITSTDGLIFLNMADWINLDKEYHKEELIINILSSIFCLLSLSPWIQVFTDKRTITV